MTEDTTELEHVMGRLAWLARDLRAQGKEAVSKITRPTDLATDLEALLSTIRDLSRRVEEGEKTSQSQPCGDRESAAAPEAAAILEAALMAIEQGYLVNHTSKWAKKAAEAALGRVRRL